jgi:hypothetical protein
MTAISAVLVLALVLAVSDAMARRPFDGPLAGATEPGSERLAYGARAALTWVTHHDSQGMFSVSFPARPTQTSGSTIRPMFTLAAEDGPASFAVSYRALSGYESFSFENVRDNMVTQFGARVVLEEKAVLSDNIVGRAFHMIKGSGVGQTEIYFKVARVDNRAFILTVACPKRSWDAHNDDFLTFFRSFRVSYRVR